MQLWYSCFVETLSGMARGPSSVVKVTIPKNRCTVLLFVPELSTLCGEVIVRVSIALKSRALIVQEH